MFDLISILRELHIDSSIYRTKNVRRIKLDKVTSMDRATNKDLTFCTSDKEDDDIVAISMSDAGAILCSKIMGDQRLPYKKNQCIILFIIQGLQ